MIFQPERHTHTPIAVNLRKVSCQIKARRQEGKKARGKEGKKERRQEGKVKGLDKTRDVFLSD